jgi:hypothetical protein
VDSLVLLPYRSLTVALIENNSELAHPFPVSLLSMFWKFRTEPVVQLVVVGVELLFVIVEPDEYYGVLFKEGNLIKSCVLCG